MGGSSRINLLLKMLVSICGCYLLLALPVHIADLSTYSFLLINLLLLRKAVLDFLLADNRLELHVLLVEG